MNNVLDRLTKALKLGGVLYVSFKHGDAESFENGRFFNDLDEPLLRKVLSSHPQVELVRVWNTQDVRNDRRGRQPWLNGILRRGGCQQIDPHERLVDERSAVGGFVLCRARSLSAIQE